MSNRASHRVLLPDRDADGWNGCSQRYKCGVRGCENTVLLPEHPTEGPVTVRAPCVKHGSVKHIAEGRIQSVGRPLNGNLVYVPEDFEDDAVEADGGEC